MNLKLLGDRVLIRPDQEQEMARGFHLVRKWRGACTTGIVWGIGTEVHRRGLSLQVGQRVMIRPNSCKPFEWEGIEYREVECRDVLMVLTGLEGLEVSEYGGRD